MVAVAPGDDEIDIEGRLKRLEAIVARLEKLEEVNERVNERFEKLVSEASAWRSQLCTWLQTEHEQVELHATILLGVAGLTSTARPPQLPDPPTWPLKVV